jgi:hypothetical protein
MMEGRHFRIAAMVVKVSHTHFQRLFSIPVVAACKAADLAAIQSMER